MGEAPLYVGNANVMDLFKKDREMVVREGGFRGTSLMRHRPPP